MSRRQEAKKESPGKVMPLRKPVKCPNCKRQSARNTYPFCSRRCQEVDMNRWFSDSYSIPGSGSEVGKDEDFNEENG